MGDTITQAMAEVYPVSPAAALPRYHGTALVPLTTGHRSTHLKAPKEKNKTAVISYRGSAHVLRPETKLAQGQNMKNGSYATHPPPFLRNRLINSAKIIVKIEIKE
jgi:hypothetical protein